MDQATVHHIKEDSQRVRVVLLDLYRFVLLLKSTQSPHKLGVVIRPQLCNSIDQVELLRFGICLVHEVSSSLLVQLVWVVIKSIFTSHSNVLRSHCLIHLGVVTEVRVMA